MSKKALTDSVHFLISSAPTPPSSTSFAPWLDLPQSLTENILERLPLSDYVRFAAVHPRWRSIQRDHRSHHSPSSPPMLPLPWILPSPLYSKLENPLSCFSPFQQKSYRLRLPPTTCGTGSYQCCCISSSHGWLLLIDSKGFLFDPNRESALLSLLNPVSGVQFELPPVPLKHSGHSFAAAMSSPPTSGDCVVILADNEACWLIRLGDGSGWTKKLNLDPKPFGIIYSRGQFYGGSCPNLVVVDPRHPKPIVQKLILEMERLAIGSSKRSDFGHILESNGELLVVEMVLQANGRIRKFRVYKADLSEKKWVRMKSLGDRALFLSNNYSFCLAATNTGLKGNCLYYTHPLNVHSVWSQETSWRVFDLGTGRMTDGKVPSATTECRILQFPDNRRCWFIPSLV